VQLRPVLDAPEKVAKTEAVSRAGCRKSAVPARVLFYGVVCEKIIGSVTERCPLS
jgi:hypothetical protein